MSQLLKIHNILDSKSFVGNDFLLWVWFQSETQESQYRILDFFGTYKKVKFWISDKITLKSRIQQLASEIAIRGGIPSESEEAYLSLKNGKEIFFLKLGLHIEDLGDFEVQLQSEHLNPIGLKMPDKDSQESWEEELHINKRLYCLRMYLRAFDHLFDKFLKIRLDSEKTDQEWAKIFQWIQKRA